MRGDDCFPSWSASYSVSMSDGIIARGPLSIAAVAVDSNVLASLFSMIIIVADGGSDNKESGVAMLKAASTTAARWRSRVVRGLDS
jgi:hypothetical protein